MATRDMSSWFMAEGADGWRRRSDVPASTGIQRSIVERRMAETLEMARFVRRTDGGQPRWTRRERIAAGITRLGGTEPAVTARTAEATGTPGAARPAGSAGSGAAARPACQG